MSHTYSNTVPAKPAAPWDRLGYLRQLTDSELDNHERQVLGLMATYATVDRELPFKAYNGQNIGTKLSLSSSTVGRVLQRLKVAGLLTKRMKRGRTFWVLPTEERIVSYTPKKR